MQLKDACGYLKAVLEKINMFDKHNYNNYYSNNYINKLIKSLACCSHNYAICHVDIYVNSY